MKNNNMEEKLKNIEKLEEAFLRINNKENVLYFLCYDTKGTARAAVKHIYDMALFLKNAGYNAKILVEDSKYVGISDWLDAYKYFSIPLVYLKEDKVEIKIDDVLVVPETYSNILPQLINVRCVKVMLIQQKEYLFETLSVGSKWSDFGFDKCITTTESSKKYINEYFPDILTYIIPPVIEDFFTKTEKPQTPIIAYSCRDRIKHRKIISEFYLKYPQLRWITFKDMVQMSQKDFAEQLKTCFVSVWVDDESTFGTFPLESMKSNVPVIGKVPMTQPDWMGENGMWTFNEDKIVEMLGTYCLAWLEGAEFSEDIKEKINQTLVPYDTEITKNNTINIFESFVNKRRETILKALENLKTEKEV